MRWQRASYNCIVSGEYTISKCVTNIESENDYFAFYRRKVIGEFLGHATADAAKRACEEHAKNRP